MTQKHHSLAVFILFLASVPADAGTLDVLQGKFGFNWRANPAREKCVKIEGPLLAAFETKYQCDLNAKSNTSSGASVRTCTEVKGKKEYLIFDTLRACDGERKDQASNE